ncbi:MAG: YbjN domain-containing protein [Actinomycetota bacterium]|nr:YbjN domain-containing protein [Actinomycetota bacterium]
MNSLEIIEATCKDTGIDYSLLEGADGAPSGVVVAVPGERRLITNTVFAVGDHSVRIEAFICRNPDEDFEKVYRYLLRRNRRLFGVAYTLDNLGDIYLVGKIALSAISPEVIDGVLGQVVQAVDSDFNMLLELGFHSSIQKEWEWRVKRGESLKNLRAFEHLIDDQDDDDERHAT